MRREQEFNAKMTKSSEGPAHHVVQVIVYFVLSLQRMQLSQPELQSIVELKRQRENEFFQTLQQNENSLNKQLQESEEGTYLTLLSVLVKHLIFGAAAAARARRNGQSLTDEWMLNTAIQLKKKEEDELRNNKVLSAENEGTQSLTNKCVAL